MEIGQEYATQVCCNAEHGNSQYQDYDCANINPLVLWWSWLGPHRSLQLSYS